VAEGDRARAERTVQELRAAGVRYVSGSMVDTGSISRLKSVPLEKLPGLAHTGIGFSCCWGVVLSNDHFTSTDAFGGASGDMRLVADLDSIVQMAPTPAWAWVALDQYDLEGRPIGYCQRSFLKRMIAAARERSLDLRMAYELEWFVGHETEEERALPVHRGPGYSANAWAQTHEFALDLLDALAAEGVAVEQSHPEYSFGQMEVSLGVSDPLTAADRHVLFRHTARTVAAQHGYRCSFSPVTVPGLGNGCHLHFSLWDGAGRNLFAGGEGVVDLTEEGEAFLAGVLAESAGLVALSCATVPSYERLQPQHWSGAYQCWGHENREAALRFIRGMMGARAQSANMEFKAADCTGHPYLIPAGVIAAGLAGLERGLSLPEPLGEDPHSLSAEERRRRGVVRLPASLGEAATALEESEVLRAAMGPELHDAMVAVRRAEAEEDEGRPLDELVAEQLWRF